jgi:hypothetical protein
VNPPNAQIRPGRLLGPRSASIPLLPATTENTALVPLGQGVKTDGSVCISSRLPRPPSERQTYRDEYAFNRQKSIFRAFAEEFSLEQAVISTRKSVQMPEADWDDPELVERMADIAAELHAAGELKD